MDKRLIHNRLTQYIILSRFDEIDDPKTTQEINTQEDRAINHYINDAIFHAKVDKDVAHIMEIIDKEA